MEVEGTVAEEQVDAPLVFQCRECRAILADSFSWVCSDTKTNTITVKVGSPNMKECPQLNTSQEEHDLGSTFALLQCVCKTVVGKVYKTTPRRLDRIRDLVTINIDNITSYKLGTGLSENALDLEILDVPTSKSLQDDIVKIQNMILLLNERLEVIESSQD
eukprot:m.157340 g.157340  ORF g.157340 m.157340 type:complete len:161 (+) comp15114_c0_seq1:87-569(+)